LFRTYEYELYEVVTVEGWTPAIRVFRLPLFSSCQVKLYCGGVGGGGWCKLQYDLLITSRRSFSYAII